MLLPEYCIIPDVFDIKSYGESLNNEYSYRQLYEVYLSLLRQILLEHGIVRNLNKGQWSEFIKNKQSDPQNRICEILKTLSKQNRLIDDKSNYFINDCKNLEQWCKIAIESHEKDSLDRIIMTSEFYKKYYHYCPEIVKIDDIEKWSKNIYSIRMEKNLDNYVKYLKPIFKHSNSLMFIDPYIREKENLRVFINIINQMPINSELVLEIHSTNDGIKDKKILENKFQALKIIKNKFKKITVYYWSNFHDRYIVSDLVGISLPHGLVTNSQKTTWVKLTPDDKADVQREFHPNHNHHQSIHKFLIK
jgi:hypothetical protein